MHHASFNKLKLRILLSNAQALNESVTFDTSIFIFWTLVNIECNKRYNSCFVTWINVWTGKHANIYLAVTVVFYIFLFGYARWCLIEWCRIKFQIELSKRTNARAITSQPKVIPVSYITSSESDSEQLKIIIINFNYISNLNFPPSHQSQKYNVWYARLQLLTAFFFVRHLVVQWLLITDKYHVWMNNNFRVNFLNFLAISCQLFFPPLILFCSYNFFLSSSKV
jgi:hypothetical protein